MINSEKFKDVFGLYATELWAMPHEDFLNWINTECKEGNPMDDLISRKSALKGMSFSEGLEADGILYVPLRDVRKYLRNLPSVQPEPCVDAVSRKDAIKDVCDALKVAFAIDEDLEEALDIITTTINELTPANGIVLSSKQAVIEAIANQSRFSAEEIIEICDKSIQDENGWLGGLKEAILAVSELPSVQPEIIRCEECKYRFHDAGYERDWCDRTTGVFRVNKDDYCSYAERKTDELGDS